MKSGRFRFPAGAGTFSAALVATLASAACFAGAAQAKPDLQITKLSAPSTARAGLPVKVATSARNAGSAAAGPSTTSFVLSKDRKPGKDTSLSPSLKVKKLKPRGTASGSASLRLPPTVSAGPYFVIACADSGRRVREGNEKNNCRTAAVKVPAGELGTSPGSLNFGSVDIETSEPVTRTLTVTNVGGATLPAIDDVRPDDIGFFPSGNACLGVSLAPGTSCEVSVDFLPSALGTQTAKLTVSAGSSSVSVNMSGTGIDVVQPAVLTIDPASQGFGSVVAGASSASQTFNVFHDGEQDSGPLSVSLTGPDSGHFQITETTCNGLVLSERTLCQVKVAFRPTSAGAKSATLSVSASPGGTPSASLTGTATQAASLSIDRSSQAFGNVLTGSLSGSQVFTITNNGTGPSGILTSQITGTDAGQFTITADTCSPGFDPQPLPAGGTCAVTVAFWPQAGQRGAKSATLSVSGTPGGTVSTTLSGTALKPPTLSANPESFNFGSVAVGGSSSQVFTITNTGDVDTRSLITQPGGGAGTFSVPLATDGCRNLVLAPNATCSFTVVFEPFSFGTVTGGFVNVFADSLPGVSVGLSGTGS